MEFRRALTEDAPAAMAVVQAGFEGYRAYAPPDWQPPDETREEEVERGRIELGDPATTAFVAVDDGRVVGHVRIVRAVVPSPDGTTPDWHLRHLFVLEDHWGTGVAKRLHDLAMADLVGTARLYTPEPQARARRFYEREGWRLHHGPHEVAGFPFPLVEYRLTRRST
jgi:GNAT superfamily N-acetyltransferase